MDFVQIVEWLSGTAPWVAPVLMGVGGLVIVAQVVVGLTPSEKDNEVVAKVLSVPVLGGFLKALGAFAPIRKK